jgi:predicted transport protein
MALSAAQMQQAVINNLPQKTGKSLHEWITLVQSWGLKKNIDILRKLKSEYGLGHVQAQTIVWNLGNEKPYIVTEGYEENIFKSTFKFYNDLKNEVLAIADDVTVRPCKTYIPFYRKTQFAILTEKSGKLLLGLNLPENDFRHLANAEKLGGSNRINKMVEVNSMNMAFVLQLIHEAYTNN